MAGEEDSGRGLWTTEEVSEGTVLFSNIPNALVLAGDFIDRRCSFCFSSSDNEASLHQCGKCKYVRYW